MSVENELIILKYRASPILNVWWVVFLLEKMRAEQMPSVFYLVHFGTKAL